ncbi:MAG: response regulator transcription factor [Candidatus Acidiferrales bacterium]
MARILIADDHAEARRGARALLEAHPGWEVCGEACDGMEAIEMAAALKPDIVILDLSMPKMSGVAAARVIRSTAPGLPVLLFSLYAGDPQMSDGFRRAGFSGDLNKAAADLLIEAVETLLQGGTYFQSANLATAIINGDGATITQQPPAPLATSTPVAPSAEPTPQASATEPANSPADALPIQPPETPPGNGSGHC